jgi:voltage-gated potassium channel
VERLWTLLTNGRLRVGFALLMLVLLIGTVGFMLTEGWSPLEALFVSMLVVSTLGFSDLRPTDLPGRLLTIGLIAAGVGTLYYFVGALAQTVIDGQFDRGRKRRMEQQIAKLRDHFIVCGFGRMGRETCRQLVKEGCAFVVIDNTPEQLAKIQEHGYLGFQGDAADDRTLQHVHIERARGLLTAVGSDADNVYITLSARTLNPQLFIVARAVTSEAEHKLRIAGASRVISPYTLGGRHMASWALRPAVMDFLDLLSHSEEHDIWFEEIKITPGSTYDGAYVGEVYLRDEAGLTILAVRQHTGKLIVNPRADLGLQVGDTLIVIGSRDEHTTRESIVR